jgi:telomerase reverse transcriptase
VAKVSAFCRAVISDLLPGNVFGSGLDGQGNRDRIMKKVDDFVQMRRFESMTVHQTMQGLRIASITWLSNPGNPNPKMSKSDYSKRFEILHEFIYYIFDSLLIPIIRAHFYVTECSTHRNRLLYFRQDVWRKLSEPSLATLRLNMYSPITPSDARHKLQSRSLGYSQLRLLPKDQGARPIANLKRKQSRAGPGKSVLGQSINTQLAPIFNILNFERARDPSPLGSALFSIGDIHGRVAEFRRIVPPGSRLFFAKVDIKSCFDSIPQEQLLRLVDDLLSEQSYRTTKHIEVKSSNPGYQVHAEGLKRKWAGVARPADEQAVFSETSISRLAARKRQVVFSTEGYQTVWNRKSVLKLLQDHIGDSMVKIEKRYMKQIDGIPQGSVLSTLLCNYFYGAFERNELGFLNPPSCLLLRLIDDFLLVTTDDKLARRFLEVMASGDRRYGIQVNPEKSLVNFDVTINGRKVPRVLGEAAFPYCGMAINVRTLEMKKDREKKDERVGNSLTVESCIKPGAVLKRKIMSSLKNQMHAMLLDLSLNSRAQVVSTLIGNYTESAMKMHRYLVGLAARKRPPQELVRGLIQDLVVAGCKICRARNSYSGQIQHITQAQMCWIAAAAFETVLERKQTQYSDLLVWLKALRQYSQPKMNMDQADLDRLLQENNKAFQAYVY